MDKEFNIDDGGLFDKWGEREAAIEANKTADPLKSEFWNIFNAELTSEIDAEIIANLIEISKNK